MRIRRKRFRNVSRLDFGVLFLCVTLLRNFDEAAVDDVTALGGNALADQFLFELLEQFPFEAEFLELFGKEPDCLGVRNMVGEREFEKLHERDSVADHQLGRFVGKVVKRLENEDFEHENNVEWLATGIGETFLVANLVELVTKGLPVDQGVEAEKEIVEFVNLFEPGFKIEKRILSVVFAHGFVKKSVKLIGLPID